MAGILWLLDPVLPCLWSYHTTGHLDVSRLLVGAGACLFAGLLCGTVMHGLFNRKGGRS